MAVDASIYGAIQQPRPVNRLADLAQVMQIQGFQQQGQLGQMKLDALRRETEQENVMNQVYRQALGADGKVDRNRLLTLAAQNNLGSRLPALQKSFAEQDKAQAEAQGKLLENTRRRVDLAGQAFGFVRANPTLENAISVIDSLGQQGIFTPEQVAQYRAQVTSNPAAIPTLAEQAFRSALDAKEQLAKYETRDTGGAVQTLRIDPVTGEIATVNSVQKTNSPDAILREQGEERRSIRADNRAREANDISRQLVIQEKQLKVDELQDKANERQRQKEAGIASIASQIGVIDKALNHPGRTTATGLSGTIDPRNFVPGTDAADFRAVLDQIGGTAFLQAFESLKGGGQITEVEGKKATDAIARLSRAQSDKEFEQSLRDLREVMAAGYKRASGKEFERPAPGGKPQKAPSIPKVSSDAEYAALPSGAEFIDPNGNRRRKP